MAFKSITPLHRETFINIFQYTNRKKVVNQTNYIPNVMRHFYYIWDDWVNVYTKYASLPITIRIKKLRGL